MVVQPGTRDRIAGIRWHTRELADVRRELQVDDEGLRDDDARARLDEYGPNEVEGEKETPWWLLLLHQFTDPLIYILLAATAVTLLLRDFVDAGVILAVVLLNATIGFVQERRAQRAMRALARMSAPSAEVVRDGEPRTIPSRELVPGDVVVLTSGVRVPADLRLSRTRELQIDESALTGESIAVRKTIDPLEDESLVPGDRTNMAFAGTVVTRGRGRGIVVHTGAATELGRIATAVREIVEPATPLQETIARFSRGVGLAVVVLAVLTALLGLLRGLSASDIFLTAVALAVSAIPEGLPVVLTVTLAIGVSRMASRNAIVRALPAVETLGSATVIGSDKTGTLTKNEMSVRAIWAGGHRFEVTGAGYALEGEIRSADAGAAVDAGNEPVLHYVLLIGTLANEADAQRVAEGDPRGDPTELALHIVAAKAGVPPDATRTAHRELDILPFESELRLMATLNESGDARTVHVKGAPEAILQRCDRMLTRDGERPLDRSSATSAAAAMAADGLRVLAMAYRPTEERYITDDLISGGLVLAGLQGMEDPVRPEAIEAVRRSHDAGIRVLMLTGDHLDTAQAIGRQLGIDPHGAGAIEGAALQQMDDEMLDSELRRVNVFARVAPEHKLRIVRQLRAHGHVVAITGDGVNDAPALREAHIGIAMGRGGTDVAKEASDVVLADDNFATITAAIEEGRVVFANIRKVTFFLLSTAVGEVLAILAALLLGWPLPFLAAQILWINLVTNGLQDVALAFEPGEPGLLERPPRPRDEGILSRRLIERLGAVGAVLAAGTLGMFWWTLGESGDVELARTVAMTQMVVFQFFHVFNCRSLDRSVIRVPLLSNRFLFVSILAALLAHVAVLYVPAMQIVFRTRPLEPWHWGVIMLVGTTVILGGELDKLRSRRLHAPLG